MDSTTNHRTGHFLQGKTIIVAGGGIAGSAFVASLRHLWDPKLKAPTVIVYDRDAQNTVAEREGYTISLSGFDNTGGLTALRKVGLLKSALDYAVSGLDGSGSFKIWDREWRELISLRREPLPGIPTPSIRIARKDLRRVLHDSMESNSQNNVQWESQCVSAIRLPNGRIRVRVIHEGGLRESEQDCDLLVAADGANSKIRHLLRPDDILQSTGAVLRGGVATVDESLRATIKEDWGFVLSRTGVSCFLSPVDKHRVLWTIGHFEDAAPSLNRASAKDIQAVINRSLEFGSHFQEPFLSIVKQTDPKSVLCLNAKDKIPFPHSDIASTPIVFIGDSNHAVSPFAGYGANLALSDGYDLAEQLCKGDSLAAAVLAYDKLSVPRATRILRGSRWRIKAGHSTGWRYCLFWLMLVAGRFVGWMLRKRTA